MEADAAEAARLISLIWQLLLAALLPAKQLVLSVLNQPLLA